jgi:GAF domain-containing protein
MPQEGFNIGILAIMDDVPQVEFSPRQRHTLKEFAVSYAVSLFRPNS